MNKYNPLLIDVSLTVSDIKDILDILQEHSHTTDCVTDDRMRVLKNLFESFERKADLENFQNHIINSMPADDDEDEWDEFYQNYWNIRYAGKAIVIENNAGIYNAMLEAIKEQIEDYT